MKPARLNLSGNMLNGFKSVEQVVGCLMRVFPERLAQASAITVANKGSNYSQNEILPYRIPNRVFSSSEPSPVSFQVLFVESSDCHLSTCQEQQLLAIDPTLLYRLSACYVTTDSALLLTSREHLIYVALIIECVLGVFSNVTNTDKNSSLQFVTL